MAPCASLGGRLSAARTRQPDDLLHTFRAKHSRRVPGHGSITAGSTRTPQVAPSKARQDVVPAQAPGNGLGTAAGSLDEGDVASSSVSPSQSGSVPYTGDFAKFPAGAAQVMCRLWRLSSVGTGFGPL